MVEDSNNAESIPNVTNFIITICIWGLLLIRNKFNQHCQKILNPWAYLFRHQIRGSVASVYAACKWWVSWKEFSLSKNLIGTLLSGYPPSLELIHKKLWCRHRIDLMKYPILCSHFLYSKTKQQCPPSQCWIFDSRLLPQQHATPPGLAPSHGFRYNYHSITLLYNRSHLNCCIVIPPPVPTSFSCRICATYIHSTSWDSQWPYRLLWKNQTIACFLMISITTTK